MSPFAKRVTPLPVADLTVCAVIGVARLDTLAALIEAGNKLDALTMLRGMRGGVRRLERVSP